MVSENCDLYQIWSTTKPDSLDILFHNTQMNVRQIFQKVTIRPQILNLKPNVLTLGRKKISLECFLRYNLFTPTDKIIYFFSHLSLVLSILFILTWHFFCNLKIFECRFLKSKMYYWKNNWKISLKGGFWWKAENLFSLKHVLSTTRFINSKKIYLLTFIDKTCRKSLMHAVLVILRWHFHNKNILEMLYAEICRARNAFWFFSWEWYNKKGVFLCQYPIVLSSNLMKHVCKIYQIRIHNVLQTVQFLT